MVCLNISLLLALAASATQISALEIQGGNGNKVSLIDPESYQASGNGEIPDHAHGPGNDGPLPPTVAEVPPSHEEFKALMAKRAPPVSTKFSNKTSTKSHEKTSGFKGKGPEVTASVLSSHSKPSQASAKPSKTSTKPPGPATWKTTKTKTWKTITSTENA